MVNYGSIVCSLDAVIAGNIRSDFQIRSSFLTSIHLICYPIGKKGEMAWKGLEKW